MHALHWHAHRTIHAHTCNTCTYMHIHAITQHTKFEMAISRHPMIRLRRAKEQNGQPSMTDKLCWFVVHLIDSPQYDCISKIDQEGYLLVHQNTENKQPISAHADVSRKICVGGQLDQVRACLNDPGRCYCRGTTNQNTKSFKGVILDVP